MFANAKLKITKENHFVILTMLEMVRVLEMISSCRRARGKKKKTRVQPFIMQEKYVKLPQGTSYNICEEKCEFM